MNEPVDVRSYHCGTCLCEFYMLDGVDPSFCPHCGAKFDEMRTVVKNELGVYEEPEAE